MKIRTLIVIFTVLFPLWLYGQTVHITGKVRVPSVKLLSRHYKEGEKLSYHMKGANKGKTQTETYEVDADGVVKKDSNGRFFEEYQWSNLVVNGNKIDLPLGSVKYRQVLSLAPNFRLPTPKIAPMLVGPILDLLTFYSDLRLAIRNGNLTHAGDHFYFPYGKPASWANGPVILGEDSIDFDVTLKEVDKTHQFAILIVRHVPPVKPKIKLPVDWMRVPVEDTPNNYVQVEKDGNKYIAEVGKETFKCEIKISLANGRILTATMDNPVEVMERKCSDETLTKCDEPIRYKIRRQIFLIEVN